MHAAGQAGAPPGRGSRPSARGASTSSRASASHSARAGARCPGAASGPSGELGHSRCRSSSTTSAGMRSSASRSCAPASSRWVHACARPALPATLVGVQATPLCCLPCAGVSQPSASGSTQHPAILEHDHAQVILCNGVPAAPAASWCSQRTRGASCCWACDRGSLRASPQATQTTCARQSASFASVSATSAASSLLPLHTRRRAQRAQAACPCTSHARGARHDTERMGP